MGFTRITKPSLAVNNITGLDNRPRKSAAELKGMFDKAGGDLQGYLVTLVAKINELIDEFEEYRDDEEHKPGAANIGAKPVFSGDGSGPNVQEKLYALKEYADNLAIKAGAGDMLSSVYVEPGGKGKVLASVDSDKLGGTLPNGYAKEISGRDEKETIADDDAIGVADSEAENTQKKTLWSTVKTVLKTFFDTLYSGISHKSRHAVGGPDELIASDIGAASGSSKNWSIEGIGWYRVAQYVCNDSVAAQGAGANGVEISFKKNYTYTEPQMFIARLMSLYGSSSFLLIGKAGINTVTTIRHTVDTVNNIAYLEIYYNHTGNNNIGLTLTDNADAGHVYKWECIGIPAPTQETVSGVSVYSSLTL
jgi:hypothetical protein